MLRVFHVDDDATVRRGFAALVASPGGPITVVGSAATAAEADAALAGGLDFEVAVVDLGLPDRRGTEVIRHIRRVRPRAWPLAFTVFDDAPTILEALKAGACGYLLKDTPPEKLRSALLEVNEGGAPMTPSVARLVVQSFQPAPPPDLEPLTARELDVLERLVRGETYSTVARALGMSVNTVQGHVRAIYGKLEVHSKTEATRVALQRGLVTS